MMNVIIRFNTAAKTVYLGAKFRAIRPRVSDEGNLQIMLLEKEDATGAHALTEVPRGGEEARIGGRLAADIEKAINGEGNKVFVLTHGGAYKWWDTMEIDPKQPSAKFGPQIRVMVRDDVEEKTPKDAAPIEVQIPKRRGPRPKNAEVMAALDQLVAAYVKMRPDFVHPQPQPQEAPPAAAAPTKAPGKKRRRRRTPAEMAAFRAEQVKNRPPGRKRGRKSNAEKAAEAAAAAAEAAAKFQEDAKTGDTEVDEMAKMASVTKEQLGEAAHATS